MDKKRLRAVVLGAGKGKRLASEEAGIPKVMRQAGGKPLLGYVLKALGFIDKKDIIIVVGYKREFIQSAFPGYNYAVQEKQLGTGHAVMAAGGQLEGFEGDVLICYGDMPLVRTKTYEQLIDYHRREKSACTILSGISDEKMDFGRILRDENGSFLGIREARDCSEREQMIREYNSGIYIFDCKALSEGLKHLDTDNVQGEYYLTDVPVILQKRGYPVSVCTRQLGNEMLGVNTKEQLELVEKLLSGDN
ncbi:MAG: NTP transferase domain-containing protein [Clostridiales bacterium]|jgi:bifunctional N-acetylglucosamine-1-phosphate-uridyltransferase/glucosamine-1-phosphate-acetyltransferase GlmU-like protein|nr:NTP transferase domain-containing protein [Clostridiales bacterium]